LLAVEEVFVVVFHAYNYIGFLVLSRGDNFRRNSGSISPPSDHLPTFGLVYLVYLSFSDTQILLAILRSQ
jgi:hypothetical protein